MPCDTCPSSLICYQLRLCMMTQTGRPDLACAWQMEAVLCRRVWRVAFFSRLEERKGIKVFVDALHKLDFAALSRSQVRLAAAVGRCSAFAFLCTYWKEKACA